MFVLGLTGLVYTARRAFRHDAKVRRPVAAMAAVLFLVPVGSFVVALGYPVSFTDARGLMNDCGTGLLLTPSTPATEDSTGARTGECVTAANDAARTIAGIAVVGLAAGLVGTAYLVLTGPRPTRRAKQNREFAIPVDLHSPTGL
jgi:hypothetical protein